MPSLALQACEYLQLFVPSLALQACKYLQMHVPSLALQACEYLQLFVPSLALQACKCIQLYVPSLALQACKYRLSQTSLKSKGRQFQQFHKPEAQAKALPGPPHLRAGWNGRWRDQAAGKFHRCGFSIKMSPRSMVSPALTENSLRTWTPLFGTFIIEGSPIRYQAPGIKSGKTMRPSEPVNGPCQ